LKILLLDIETAPNLAHVWGLWNQNVGTTQLIASGYTLCFSAKWFNDDEVMFHSIHHDGETEMLYKLWNLLDEADAVVHYNGTKFDIPTCNKEFITHNIAPPSSYHQIDLLKVARDRFRFPSNKLDYVAQALGVGKKVKHIGHELWIKCMAGDNKAWEMMREYNVQDVALLERVYVKMLPWIKNHPNHGLYTDETVPVCPNCGSKHVIKKGTETTKTVKYQRYRCMGCGTPVRGRYSILDREKSKIVLTQSKL
jgi:DNA polymerase elongation subunit (family B)/DNA-directed RNA polymerase subunit RPC12/RpoP